MIRQIIYWANGEKYEEQYKDDKKMVKGHFIGLIEISMKENTKMIREMVEEYFIGLMEIDMRENSKMTY